MMIWILQRVEFCRRMGSERALEISRVSAFEPLVSPRAYQCHPKPVLSS